MNNAERPQGFDPYQALAANLDSGDALNRWLLRRARQKIVDLLRGQRVLDVCCGTGNLTAMLAEAGCAVVGVDRSATMLAQARRKPVKAEFRSLDAARLPFDQEFDAAVISIALHEMPPEMRIATWDSMVHAVHPGGRLVALDFAVPEHNSLLARLMGGLIAKDEASFQTIHPEHYANYLEFMRSGGLTDWIRQRGQRVEAQYRFWGGTLALVVVRQMI